MEQTITQKIIELLPQLTKFIITGGTATLVHMGAFYVFKQSMHVVTATTLGFLIGFVVSFTLQKFWTFNDQKGGSVHKQGVSFFVLQVSNLIVNGAAMHILVNIFGVWDMLAQFLVLGTLAVSTFIISKVFIFRGSE